MRNDAYGEWTQPTFNVPAGKTSLQVGHLVLVIKKETGVEIRPLLNYSRVHAISRIIDLTRIIAEFARRRFGSLNEELFDVTLYSALALGLTAAQQPTFPSLRQRSLRTLRKVNAGLSEDKFSLYPNELLGNDVALWPSGFCNFSLGEAVKRSRLALCNAMFQTCSPASVLQYATQLTLLCHIIARKPLWCGIDLYSFGEVRCSTLLTAPGNGGDEYDYIPGTSLESGILYVPRHVDGNENHPMGDFWWYEACTNTLVIVEVTRASKVGKMARRTIRGLPKDVQFRYVIFAPHAYPIPKADKRRVILVRGAQTADALGAFADLVLFDTKGALTPEAALEVALSALSRRDA